MSRRFFPPKNSGKMNGGRRDERGRSDRVGHTVHYDGSQSYQHGGHYGGEEKREERSRWNRGGAGRNSEESSRSNGHRGNDHRYDDRIRHGNHSPRGQLNMSEHLENNDGHDQKFRMPEGHNGYYDGENPYRHGGQNGGGGRRREDVSRIGRSRRGSESEDWDNRPVTNWAEYYAKQEWNEREGEKRNAMRRAEQAAHAMENKEEEREADLEVAKKEEDEDEKTETKLEAVRRLIRGHEKTLPKLRELRRDMIEAGQETQKLEEVEEGIRDSENTLKALREAERVTLGEFQRRPPMRARLSTPPLSPIAPAPLPAAVVRSPNSTRSSPPGLGLDTKTTAPTHDPGQVQGRSPTSTGSICSSHKTSSRSSSGSWLGETTA